MRAPAQLRGANPGHLIVAALTPSIPALAADTVLDGIVAVVNGKIITKYELDERLRPVYEQIRGRQLSTDEIMKVQELKKKALDQMVEDQLLIDESVRYKLTVSDTEVQEQIKAFLAKRKLSDEEFKRQLELQRMTRSDFMNNMRRDMIRHRLVGGVVSNKIVVTDTEIEERYNERKAEFSQDSMVELALILLPAGVSAADVKADVEAGKMTFAQAAEKYSQGPNASKGGDIGYIAWKDLAPEWNAALVGLKPGEISKPVLIQSFEGLLQVVNLKQGEVLPLEAVRDQIYQSLHDGKFEKSFQEYMQKLRDKAVIEYKTL
jgi:peptidyl-prolyl cis-trans isomerase SurA